MDKLPPNPTTSHDLETGPSETTLVLPRHLSLYLTPNGIILQPGRLKPKQEPTRVASLQYTPRINITVIENWQEPILPKPSPIIKAEFDGLVGVLELFHDSYLILISAHSIAGSFRAFQNKKTYKVNHVLALPLDFSRASFILKDHLKRRSPVDFASPPQTINRNLSVDIHSGTDDEQDTDEPSPSPSPPDADEDPPVLMSHPTPDLNQSRTPSAPPSKAGLARFLWKPKPTCRPDRAGSLASEGKPAIVLEHTDPLCSSTNPTSLRVDALLTGTLLPPGNRPRALSASDCHPSPKNQDAAARAALDRKIIKELCAELSHGGMYYALDWDVTHCLQKQSNLSADVSESSTGAPPPSSPGLPGSSNNRSNNRVVSPVVAPQPTRHLYKRADRRFWWNRYMIHPFVQAGLDSLVYVIMQGYVESTTVYLPLSPGKSLPMVVGNSMDSEDTQAYEGVDLHPVELGLISRRSLERPGLRYQRRGADINGSTANFVETEFLIGSASPLPDPHLGDQLWSFVQIRGSIPLFWGQSPWALKPPPVLEGNEADNLDALRKHFAAQMARYGDILVVCLAEKTGNEGKLVNEYERQVQALNSDPLHQIELSGSNMSVKYLGWDFHRECRGMHYENLSKLIDEALDDLLKHGYYSASEKRQTGVIRSNCIDCLDRTNVVQSAFAKQILKHFVVHLGLPSHAPALPGSDGGLDAAFNQIWANNGDQISKQYAGTSALKGDFVRTGKRDWKGVVNDATNSVARLWLNTMSDFFKQTVLDYSLGVNQATFSQFQDSLSATDPGELLRLSKVRSNAIESASLHILPEGESKVGGWSLLSPVQSDTKQCTEGFSERVLLLSNKALYAISYDYGLQKVEEFTRIGLDDITRIQKGIYVISALEESGRDEKENYGLVVYYDVMGVMKKVNTYTVALEPPSEIEVGEGKAEPSVERMMAFKALRSLDSRSTSTSCQAMVQDIVEQIVAGCAAGAVAVGEEPIVSVEQAEKETGLLARMTRGVKHLIW